MYMYWTDSKYEIHLVIASYAAAAYKGLFSGAHECRMMHIVTQTSQTLRLEGLPTVYIVLITYMQYAKPENRRPFST